MKPGAHLKLLPRTARRKLSTATVYTTQSSPLYFDVLPQTSQPSGSSSTHSGGPSSSPRILKGPSQPTTALTPYSPPPTHSGTPSSAIAHPRYTTNSSHAYPGGNGLPLVWFVPTSTNSGRSEIERRLPWEGPSEGKGKERRTFSLEMGAYGIPKRRKTQQSEEQQRSEELQQEQQHVNLSASAPTSSPLSSTSGASKEDPAAFSLAVQVGEDAYFLRPDALGVADGVGGWKHKGESNSALFAKKLMHFCSYELAQQQEQQQDRYPTPPPSSASTPTSSTATSSPPPTSGPDPVQILQTSYERCIQDAKQSGMLGSSTATLAVLAESELRIAHVGDCIVCVVRDGEMVFRSEEMQHSFNYPYQLGPRSDTVPATHAQRLTVPVKANDIVILASDGMGDNLWDEDVLDEINRFIRTSPLSSSPSQQGAGGALSFSASSTSSSTPPSSSPLLNPHAPAGPVTNTVLAQRLSEALASRAKRVSERKAMTADASGTMGAFAPKRTTIPPPPKGPPPPPPPSSRPASTSAPMPIPSRPAAAAAPTPSTSQRTTQTPTPPPSPLLKPIPVVEGMELPIHKSITQSDGQLDDDVLGDGFGGDGEYGGAGLGGLGWGAEEEEPEWVRDEIPFSRRAREAGVRFVGGKGDDISVLVAIISSVPEPSAEPPQPAPAYHHIRSSSSSAIDALAKLRLNATR